MRDWMSIDDVREMAGVTPRTVRNLARRYGWRQARRGRRVVYSSADVLAAVSPWVDPDTLPPHSIGSI